MTRPKICSKNMNFNECELAILRSAIDEIGLKESNALLQSEETKRIIQIVEDFLRNEKLICYGGTAINNILPEEDQFYDKETEFPDYDFFSYKALDHAKMLADIYYKAGFTEVEAKAGVHHGTYKVFVNFLPVADITQIPELLFKAISKESISVAGIHYSPPNYLRMAMYLELSRPKGDVSRWEKVLKRLTLLNKNYPLVGDGCSLDKIQRELEVDEKVISFDDEEKIYEIVKESFINQGLVFFGAMANSMYMKEYDPKYNALKIPDFDVLAERPEVAALIVKERLQDAGIKGIKTHKQDGVGEIIAPHYEVKVKGETIAFIYEPLACHSYNVIKVNKKSVKVATIDTMLSFYLAFIYANRPYYDVNRIICMSEYLFKVQEKNRLAQKGLLKRFSMNCIGKQLELNDIRVQKSNKYKELKNKRGTREYEEWFLKYNPYEEDKEKREKKHNKTRKNKKYFKTQTKKLQKKGKKNSTKKRKFGFFSL